MAELDWLQYGAFGLLVVILGVVGKWLRDRLAAERAAQETRDQNNENRIAKQQKFLQELVEADRVDRRTQMDSWKRMVKADIATRSGVVTALQKIGEAMDRNCEVAEARHSEIMASLAEQK